MLQMNYPKSILIIILILFFYGLSGFSETVKLTCEGSKNFIIQIENNICVIENQKWEIIEYDGKYLLCEISDPQLKIFEINLITNEAIYEDTDTDEIYELVCSEKI